MSKNNYIQNKSLKTFFIASVLISAITQINSMIDGVIVSHFVSPDALSVLGLASPVMSILYMLASMISMGASIMVTKEIGMQNYTKVSKLFIASILSASAITAVIAAGLYSYSDDIAILLTEDVRLLDLMQSYFPVAFIGSIIIAVQVITMMFVKLVGRPDLVTKAVVVECVSNIVLDVLLVGILGFGISGAAWATTLSCLLCVLFLVPFLLRSDSMISWIYPKISWFLENSKNSIVNGVPAAIGNVAMAVFMFLLNYLVLNSQGPDGLFVLSVGIQIFMISMLILGGAGDAITGIGGVMLGEKDIDSYRSLVIGILKKCSIALAVFTIVLMLCPGILAHMFGATDRMLPIVCPPLRLFCLSLLPMGITVLLSNSYLLQGYKILVSLVEVLMLVCIIPPLWLSSVFCPEYLWYSLPLGFWLMLITMLCCTIFISYKDKTVHWLTLISKLPNDPNVSISVNYDRESVQQALDQIHTFLDICELEHEVYYKIDSCLEELTYNLIAMTEDTGKKGRFDLRVVDNGTKILVTMKDDGKPYNPVIRYNAEKGCDAEKANLAIVMINSLCPELNYKYMNGINCVYMNFNYKE